MSKPINGISWLLKCPTCGNNKSKTVTYKEYEKYKCCKCGNEFIKEKK